jgi:hypothetical protein
MNAVHTRPVLTGLLAGTALLALLLASCFSPTSDANSTPPPQGQITRPTDAGLPLGDPAAVAAFDAANRFLIDWLFRDDPARAAERMSLDLRPTWTQFLQDTLVEGGCTLTQVSGEPLDAEGVTTAGYRISNCEITSPDGRPATEVRVTVTSTGENIWITGVEFV